MHHQEDNILVKAVKPTEQANNTQEDQQKTRGEERHVAQRQVGKYVVRKTEAE